MLRGEMIYLKNENKAIQQLIHIIEFNVVEEIDGLLRLLSELTRVFPVRGCAKKNRLVQDKPVCREKVFCL